MVVGILVFHKSWKYKGVIDDVIQWKQLPQGQREKWWEMFHSTIRGKHYTDWVFAHKLTTCIHLVNCVLIWVLFGRTQIAFAAALLFCVNPSNTQGGVWISGKGYALSCMFALLSLIFIQWFPLLILPSLLFASTALLVPCIFLVKQPHLYFLTLPLILYVYYTRVHASVKTRMGQSTTTLRTFSVRKVIVGVKTYMYYLCHSVFPRRIAMFHTFIRFFGMRVSETEYWYSMSPLFWCGCGTLYLLVTNVIHNPTAFVWGWLAYTLLVGMWCNFITIQQTIGERYLYLPNVFLMFALAHLPPILVFGLLVYYIVQLCRILPQYKDAMSFFRHNASEFPDCADAWNSYGAELWSAQRIGSAMDVWQQGITLREKDFKLANNIGGTLMGVGNWVGALHYLEMARDGCVYESREVEYIPVVLQKIEQCREEIKRRGLQVAPIVQYIPIVSNS